MGPTRPICPIGPIHWPCSLLRARRRLIVMPHPKNVVELLQDLVTIPSVNPQGNPGTEFTGEQALGDYVLNFLRTLGAEADLHHVEIGRPNVIAEFKPEKPAVAHIAFAPHLDTVSVAGMTISPF